MFPPSCARPAATPPVPDPAAAPPVSWLSLVLALLPACPGSTPADDDTAAGPSPHCDAVPTAVVAACPRPGSELDGPVHGTFTDWGAPAARFSTDDGRALEIDLRQDGDGLSDLPALGTLGPLWLLLQGTCEGNKDGTVLAAAPTQDFTAPYLVLTNREHTEVGPLVIDAPRDVATCAGVDRGGCWPLEHAKPVTLRDATGEWTAWQGPPDVLGPWRVGVMAAFSGAGDVRCENCCSTERLAVWVAAVD